MIEETDVTVNCDFIPGNPNSTTLFWKRRGNNTGFIQNGAILLLPKIKRTSSGIYECIAQNNFSNGMNGTHNQSLFIDVQCKFAPITVFSNILDCFILIILNNVIK